MPAINFGFDSNNAGNGSMLIQGVSLTHLGVNNATMQPICDECLGGPSVMTRTAATNFSPATVMASRMGNAVMFIPGSTTAAQRALIAGGYQFDFAVRIEPTEWHAIVQRAADEIVPAHIAAGQPVPTRIYLGGFSFGGAIAQCVAQRLQTRGSTSELVVTFGSPMASRNTPTGANLVATFRYMGWTDIIPSIMPPEGQAGALYLALSGVGKAYARGFRHWSSGARIDINGRRTFDSTPPITVGFADVSVAALYIRGTGSAVANHNIPWYIRALAGAAELDRSARVQLGAPLTNPPQLAAVVVPPVVVPPGPPAVIPGVMPLPDIIDIQPTFIPAGASKAFFVRHRKPSWVVIQLGNVVAVFTKKRDAKRAKNHLNKLLKDGLL